MFAIIQDAIKSKSKKYNFPISSIDDIGVRVEITKTHLVILSNSINCCDMDNTLLGCFYIQEHETRHIDFNEEHLVKVNTILEKLVFNKFMGKFKTEVEDEEPKYITEKEYVIGLNNPKIKVMEKYSECCVCLCNTMSKTKCKHFICIPCADKIEEWYCGECDDGECNDEDCSMKRCPICRQTLTIN